MISIHASRGGSDMTDLKKSPNAYHFNPRFPRGKRRKELYSTTIFTNFNPRFPRGKRHSIFADTGVKVAFQSTLPAGEATDAGVIMGVNP